MTEVEKKGIGKVKAGLVVCAVLVVILAVSNVWSYTSLQNQVNQLHTDKTNLESQLDSLNTEYWDLYANYTQENWWHHYYENQTVALQFQIEVLTNEKNQLQTWLDGNKTLLQTTIAERDQLQTWLSGNITNYESQITNLQNQITSLQFQIGSLNSTYQDYMATHGYTNDEYWDLYANYTQENWWHHYYENLTLALKAPKLSVLSVYSGDVRPWLGTPYLHVYGEVWNVGSDTAYNCRLHVILYQGSVVAEDTYVNLGTISGENKKSVDANIYYNGDALTSWSITPEWTTAL